VQEQEQHLLLLVRQLLLLLDLERQPHVQEQEQHLLLLVRELLVKDQEQNLLLVQKQLAESQKMKDWYENFENLINYEKDLFTHSNIFLYLSSWSTIMWN
jgi:hypothetical protein